MAYRYRRYRRRSSPLEELAVLAIVVAIAFVWQWQKSNPDALIYLYAAAIVLAVIVVGLAIRKYIQSQRRLRALDIAAIDTMDPLEFEKYIAILLKHRGFSNIRLTERYDYGVDIIARKNGLTWGVQVKRYSNLVKAEAVRQVVTGLIRYKCDRAMVVTNSTFSRPARILADDNKCVLIGREELSKWIVQFQTSNK